ncbi:hypothetical protein SORBI_3010G211000 [Sorghum bicolor]|uniref:NAD(P)-binding domain-containing protein n=1 Tax=Sorghum bicolor TaxID=4558 RepID=A0A194YKM0_SORBI|nr:hypothetical protein SORBI_3010G211000 [Sorghum bicolor]OQU76794.1 hypothetical protein SORBI_3010G211000 [Sorghum bicolor]
MENNSSNGVRVCVTGGAGFIGSWLVKKLLEKGYTVHATLRNIGDDEESGLLRRMVPGAAESGRLVLFEADLYDAATFAPAIAGCQFVFLVATPLRHDATSTKRTRITRCSFDEKEDLSDFFCFALGRPPAHDMRAVQEHGGGSSGRGAGDPPAVRGIQDGERASSTPAACMVACSPLEEDPTGFKDAVDESCWTPLDVDYPLRNADFDEYIVSKLVSEKELLAYNAAVWLGAGSCTCAAAYPTFGDVVGHFAAKYPHLDIRKETEVWPSVQAPSDKLGELGFRYEYGMEEILDGSIDCPVRLGILDASKLIVQE